MQSQQAQQTQLFPARAIVLALTLLAALVLAGAGGYWVKGISLQSRIATSSVTIAHQQAPDALERNQRLGVGIAGLPGQYVPSPSATAHQQAPDATERTQNLLP